MTDAASFDAIMQCNLLEVFCEALGAAIFVTDKLDQVTFASIRLLHFYPLRQTAIEPGSRARDLYGALYDAGCRFGQPNSAKTGRGRDEWIAERIAVAWRERVDTVEQIGPDRWMRIVSRRFSSGLGFVVMQDVSEQKKKEILLKAEQERVRLTEEILDTLPVAVAVKDRNLHFAAVNQEFCDIVQLPAAQILGKSIWDITDADLARRLEEADWQLLANGEIQEGDISLSNGDGEISTYRQRARRIGRPGHHHLSMSLMRSGVNADRSGFSQSPASRPAEVPVSAVASPAFGAQEVRSPASRNVLYLVGSHYGGHALSYGLGAHDIDLCLIRNEQEFAAFIPAAADAGLTIDFVLIDGDFSPTAFNIAANAGLDFRMLPAGSEDSTALSEILRGLARREREEAAHSPAVAAGPQALPRLVAAPAAPEPAEARLDVLAVEDNAVNRMALEQILESLNVGFAIVGSGQAAIAAAADRKPRLVLADLTLPDMDIDEFAGALRQAEPALPIIGMMPADTEMNRHRCAVAGLKDSLAKPLSPEILDFAIRPYTAAGANPTATKARPAA